MKSRDAANVLRSVSAIHMRDAANVLRSVPTVHMRDAANALKTAYSSGPPPGMTITPASKTTFSSTNFANASNFTASLPPGTPSSIVWSVENLSQATASVTGGQGTTTATINLISADDGVGVGSCTIRCTAVIAGTTYTATAYKEHDYDYGGGGGFR